MFHHMLPFPPVSLYTPVMRRSFAATIHTYPWKRQLLCFIPLWVLLCAIWLLVGTDDQVTRHFSALREEWPDATRVMQVLTHWTLRAFYFFWAGLCLYCLYKGNRRGARQVALFALVQIVVTMLLVQAVKWTVGRPRPLLALEGVGYLPWSFANASHSFPSGHTAEASGAGSSLALWTRSPLWCGLIGLIIAFVGFSRIYLSKHHLSDVAAGSLVGLVAGLLFSHLCSRETS